jgi:D-glycero-alpha-D-manno-heptose-7-phosphate kinase
MIISCTPFRITLGGGGTDLPSFYQENGGHVITMAIDKYIYITFKRNFIEEQLKLRYSITEIVDNAKDLKHDRAREALLLHNIVKQCEVNSSADLPANSGMGSSGSYTVGLLNVLRQYKRINNEPAILAQEACDIEINKLKHPVGKQDQFIAAFGGVKILDIKKDGKVNVSNLNIAYGDMISFLSNIQVYYLNVQRNASEILTDQQKNIKNSNNILHIVKEQSYKILDIFSSCSFDDYGLLLDEYWQLKKQLSLKITVPIVNEIYETVKSRFGVLGGKIIGAGGGGFLLLYVPKNRREVDQFMKQYGCNRLYFNIDEHGSRILGNF